MQVESYILNARVVNDDGTRSLVIVQGSSEGDKFAELVPEGVAPQGPVPTTVEPDLDAIRTICEAVAATHEPTPDPAKAGGETPAPATDTPAPPPDAATPPAEEPAADPAPPTPNPAEGTPPA